MSLDHELKRALRAEDPGDAFTARVLARAQADARARESAGASPAASEARPAPRTPRAATEGPVIGLAWGDGAGFGADVRPPTHPSRHAHVPLPPPEVVAPNRTRQRWVWVATLAASLLLTAGGAQWAKHRQDVAEGERARAEVMAALRLTSAKLALVRAAVADSETAAVDQAAH